MIRFIRSVQSRPGYLTEALAWAKEVQAHAQKEGSTPPGDVFVEPLGSPGRIYFIVDHESLATLEETMKRRMGDQQWAELLRRGNECIVPGTAHDIILRST
jgi:NIPSNAP